MDGGMMQQLLDAAVAQQAAPHPVAPPQPQSFSDPRMAAWAAHQQQANAPGQSTLQRASQQALGLLAAPMMLIGGGMAPPAPPPGPQTFDRAGNRVMVK